MLYPAFVKANLHIVTPNKRERSAVADATSR
jgi:hypothetical protein